MNGARTGTFARLASWASGNLEALLFWTLALVHLTPVWAFTYVPTQDGPAHVNNALIIQHLIRPRLGYSDFYEFRGEQVPNWTSHLLLTAFLYILPPLVAEKALVSLYILGFAAAYRYFLAAFGPRAVALSWVALLLIYQRCFWMGFYNYCLGLIVLWLSLGFVLHWRGRLHIPHMLVLVLLFTIAYFTHLMIFLIAAAGAVLAAVVVPPRRVLAPVIVCIAALPAACLTMDYLEVSGFLRAEPGRGMLNPLARLSGSRTGFLQDLMAIDNELFAYHVGNEVPGTLVLVFLLALLALFTVLEFFDRSPEEHEAASRLFPALFGLSVLLLYFWTRNHIGEHGGYLKTRLPPLFFLAWIACLRESHHLEARVFFRALTVMLIALNLTLVFSACGEGNRQIAQYTAGIDAVGSGQRLFFLHPEPRPHPLVNPLAHASDYYCLGTGNVTLDNYEADTRHFPVKYRKGIRRGRNFWTTYPNQGVVDVVISWQSAGNPPPRGPAGWDEVFHQGALRIYRRPQKN